MIGICSKSFAWITHFLFIVARRKPKLSLMKSIDLEKGRDFEIQPRRIEFKMEKAPKIGSLFLSVLIRKMIIEWYLFCF
jgi:hypothetical protein